MRTFIQFLHLSILRILGIIALLACARLGMGIFGPEPEMIVASTLPLSAVAGVAVGVIAVAAAMLIPQITPRWLAYPFTIRHYLAIIPAALIIGAGLWSVLTLGNMLNYGHNITLLPILLGAAMLFTGLFLALIYDPEAHLCGRGGIRAQIMAAHGIGVSKAEMQNASGKTKPKTHKEKRAAYVAESKALAKHDNGLMISYRIVLSVMTILMGLWLIYVFLTMKRWAAVDHPLLAELTFGFSPRRVDKLYIAAIILMLIMMPADRFRGPTSLFRGVGVALFIFGCGFLAYNGASVLLRAGVVSHAQEFQDILPLLAKALAGMAMTASILLGFTRQLNRSKSGVNQIDAPLAPPDMEQLRGLRHARMGN